MKIINKSVKPSLPTLEQLKANRVTIEMSEFDLLALYCAAYRVGGISDARGVFSYDVGEFRTDDNLCQMAGKHFESVGGPRLLMCEVFNKHFNTDGSIHFNKKKN